MVCQGRNFMHFQNHFICYNCPLVINAKYGVQLSNQTENFSTNKFFLFKVSLTKWSAVLEIHVKQTEKLKKVKKKIQYLIP